MPDYALSAAQVAQYEEEGFLLLPDFFPRQDMDQMLAIARADKALQDNANDRLDSAGKVSRLSLRYDLPASVYSAYARHRAIVEPMEQLIGQEVFHYHHKMMLKEPRVGGAWEWHQDYGYWYYNGCVAPKMLSFMIALDRTDTENGCLKLIRKSHKLGRLDHVQVTPEQNCADPRHMDRILETHDVVDCVLDPGDVVVFHGNTLHRSDQNRSEKRRWTLLCCYNAISNDTVTKDDDRYYVPLEKVPDSAIKSAGLKLAGSDNMEHFTSKPYVPDLKKAS